MTQPIRVYNTLSRAKEQFQPLEDDHVRIYACGVTPYAEAHIGHARPSLVWSVIRKYLEARGYRVTLVQNFTDVDDKIIERAGQEGEEPLQLAARFVRSYMESMRRLGIEDADHYPLVSEHMPQIIAMIEVARRQGLCLRGRRRRIFRRDALCGLWKVQWAASRRADGGHSVSKRTSASAIRWTLPCGRRPSRVNRRGTARGDRDVRGGTSNAPRCRCTIWATGSTFTAAAWTWCFRTTKTKSRSPKRIRARPVRSLLGTQRARKHGRRKNVQVAGQCRQY